MNVVRLLLVGMLLALLAGCGGGAPAPEDEPEETTVRMGYVPVIIFAPVYLAVERGYFADENINVELTAFQSTNDAVVQLGAGNFDVAVAGGNAGVFNAINQGLPFTVVAPMHSESPPLATPLIISADRTDEIESAADLRGKVLGVNGNGAAIEYWLAQALAQGGVSMDEVQVRAVPFPAMPAALANGTLDGAVLSEPLVTINQQQGLIAVLSDDYLDGFTATYVMMNQDWLADNEDTARRFLRAYLRACRDLQGDYMNAEIAAMIELYTDVPAAIVQESALAQYHPDGTIPVEDIATLQEFFMERGVLEYDTLLDVSSFVNTELIGAVAEELE